MDVFEISDNNRPQIFWGLRYNGKTTEYGLQCPNCKLYLLPVFYFKFYSLVFVKRFYSLLPLLYRLNACSFLLFSVLFNLNKHVLVVTYGYSRYYCVYLQAVYSKGFPIHWPSKQVQMRLFVPVKARINTIKIV